MYTRADFGRELKEKVTARKDRIQIGAWAYQMYMEHITEINDVVFDEVLISLGTMEMGPEFHLSYERLGEIANDLIAGKKEINLDY